MAEVIRAIPEGEPCKKNTLVIHIETEDANKKLDELIEKAKDGGGTDNITVTVIY